jgi:hypothetical protein
MLIAWIVVASVAVVVTTFADDRLHSQVESQRAAVVTAEHRTVIRERLEGILIPGAGGLPVAYALTIYAPSPDEAFLIPIFPRVVSLADPAIFPTGVGATGKAWDSPDNGFVVTGPAVASDKHGLTPLQQQCYRPYAVVASVVVRNSMDEPVGVLSAISRTNDGFFDQESGIRALQSIADEVAWVMPEAIQWMMPMGEEVRP